MHLSVTGYVVRERENVCVPLCVYVCVCVYMCVCVRQWGLFWHSAPHKRFSISLTLGEEGGMHVSCTYRFALVSCLRAFMVRYASCCLAVFSVCVVCKEVCFGILPEHFCDT